VKRKLKPLQLQFEQRKRYWKNDVVEVQRHLRNECGTSPRTWVNITKPRGTSETDGMVQNLEDVAVRLRVKVL